MKNVREFLNEEWEENSGHITKKTILNTASNLIGSYQSYADIEGLYMAVYTYWEHNVMSMTISENDKWVGYELILDNEKTDWLLENIGKDTVRLIVPQWVMKLSCKDENHAKNLFNKYLKLI